MASNRSSKEPHAPPTSWRTALEDTRRRRDELDKMRASRLAVLQRAGAAMRSLRDSMAVNAANDVDERAAIPPSQTGVYRTVRRDDDGGDGGDEGA